MTDHDDSQNDQPQRHVRNVAHSHEALGLVGSAPPDHAGVAWCGASLSMLWFFQDAEHVLDHLSRGPSGIAVCDDCIRAMRAAIESERRAVNHASLLWKYMRLVGCYEGETFLFTLHSNTSETYAGDPITPDEIAELERIIGLEVEPT